LKFGGDALIVELQLIAEGILKIMNFMWFRNLQIELLSTCILKHIKYYFGGSLGE